MQDWKDGTPTPHKQICGKLLQETDLEPPSTAPSDCVNDDGSTTDGIPEPDPAYTRSPALLYHIDRLRQYPQIDYVVCAVPSDLTRSRIF